MESPKPRRVSDADALKALAHPLRVALLHYLTGVGPRTASECAEAVGSNASNCSWHLRQLAKFGFVEPVEGGSGRERPWRATEVGFDLDDFADDPATRTQRDALVRMQLNEDNRLTARFLDRQEELPKEWVRAAALHGYTVNVTPAELGELLGAVDELLRPYLVPVRKGAPEGAEPAHIGIRAFPR
ncbi:winged helix-turn-helix domain-containing protein [Nocardia mexicana]|uniref:ArsR family transcriptional regulator n=1 Tax=Nocardia mexicana TaxID=279262 RepID=A0A370H3Y5_9NOCA|nr:helix-turn-helix domain-containing protein [Nocardia mexicana]RDI50614.1 ArsR family transcriptional regulator [Nocardia mexicana]